MWISVFVTNLMNLEWCVHHHRDRAPQSQVVGAAPGIERGGVAKGRGERERARGVGEWAETDESHETLVLEGGRPTDGRTDEYRNGISTPFNHRERPRS